jgi:hypothetical protein
VIFVGYEEHRVGWRVWDLKGKYFFSNNVIFDENLPARLGVPRTLSYVSPDSKMPPPSSHNYDRPCIHMSLGQVYNEVIALKRSHNESRQCKQLLQIDDIGHAES